MSDFSLNIMLDAASLQQIAALANWKIRLNSHIMAAIGRSLPEVESTAVTWMYGNFKNPTGALEGAWEQHMESPTRGVLTNTSPYGQRRHFGFSGKTDALGRFYPHDPGIEWADHAVELASPWVEKVFYEELNLAAMGV